MIFIYLLCLGSMIGDEYIIFGIWVHLFDIDVGICVLLLCLCIECNIYPKCIEEPTRSK